MSSASDHPGLFELKGSKLVVPSLHADGLPVTEVEESPCTHACPAGINVKSYISLISDGRFNEALEVVRESCPLPGVCGRVCTHPCEDVCLRADFDEPVAIRNLKRFISDLEFEYPPPKPPTGPDRGKKVAIIGSGPAGLTAAYDLRREGYSVTIFESESEPGGMLRYGIAAYRLPHDVLAREIEHIVGIGIELKTGVKIGKDIEMATIQADYDAVLVAVGAQKGRKLGIDGEEGQKGVEDALAFLRRANAGDHTAPGKKVMVIGGGSTAIEAARTALRVGSEQVHILYRRTKQEMPCSPEEVHEAEAEGINVQLLVAPNKVIADNGALKGLECLKCELGEPDSSGRRRPVPIKGSEFLVEGDCILGAVSQDADLSFMNTGDLAEYKDKRWVDVDDELHIGDHKDILAAGDVVTGPSTVVAAIGHGHKAATSIRRFLEGDEYPEPEIPDFAAEYRLPGSIPTRKPRIQHPVEALRKGKEYNEVEKAYSPEQAINEGKRCLRCGPCTECRTCVVTCEARHAMVKVPDGTTDGKLVRVRIPAKMAYEMEAGTPLEGWFVTGADEQKVNFEVRPSRTYIRSSYCRACGLCIEACPFEAIEISRVEGRPSAKILMDKCRGCNLCTTVCTTGAALSGTHSPAWWDEQYGDLAKNAALRKSEDAPRVLVTCEGSRASSVVHNSANVKVVQVTCIGQVNAGQLLELCRNGAERIVISACGTSECRYQSGVSLASKQVDRAREMLRLMGFNEDVFQTDWTGLNFSELLAMPLEVMHV